MASLTDTTYFPPLGECLSGKRFILSWNLVASALDDTSSDRITSVAVSTFLRDGYIHHLIKTPSQLFAPPSPQTKTDFDTKTAAINVVPDPSNRYDLDAIKNDALWLSKNANINEVAALRIVAIEFQLRAHNHLNGPLSSQDIVNIQEAAGVSDAQASSILALLNTSAAADAETTWAEFETETRRRQRILAAYLSERRSFMSAADSLLTFSLHSRPASSTGPNVDSLRRDVLKDAFGYDELASVDEISIEAFEALVPSYILLLDDCLDRSQTAPATVDAQILTEQLEVDWIRTALTEAAHAISLAFQALDLAGSIFASPELVSKWFSFVDTYEFLELLQPVHELVAELIMPLKSLVCAMSLKVLNLPRALAYLNREIELLEFEDAYVSSADVLEQIHATLTAAANANILIATPVTFAWSLILHRMYIEYQDRAERRDTAQNQLAQDRFELDDDEAPGRGRRNSAGSIISIEKAPYDVFLVNRGLERDLQTIEQLALFAAQQGQVYDLISEMSTCLGSGQMGAFRPVVGARARVAFQDLLKMSFDFVGYQTEPVTAMASLLSAGRQYWDISLENSLTTTQGATARMLEDDVLRRNYLKQALNRYPCEFTPFANFCRILSAGLVSDDTCSELVMKLLLETPSLTVDWRPEWQQSVMFYEDDLSASNAFELAEDIDLFLPGPTVKRKFGGGEKFSIPMGTQGRFVSDNSSIALLEYEHSALALLGKRLEENVNGESNRCPLRPLTPDEVVEGIALLATVLRAQVLRLSGPAPSAGSEPGMEILKEASRSLPRTKDIIGVICDTLDVLIQQDLAQLDGTKIATMSACLQFLHAALAVCPGRIWTYVARCGLVNSETRAGRLSRITGNLDMFSERFDFLSSAIKFFSSLVDSAMTSAVERKSGTTANSRLGSGDDENPWVGTSDKILSRVSLLIAQTTVDVFENTATWRFPSEIDRSILVRDVVGIMDKIASYSFSIGTLDSPTGLTSCLVLAARYILDGFVSTSSSALRFQPLLATLLVAFQIPESTLYPQRSRIIADRLISILSFADTLLRAASYLNQSSTVIQTQLFKSASLIARLPAVRHAFRAPSITLLSALVGSAGKGSTEPPSLLGYLGTQISRSFIQTTSQLDKPFDRIPESVTMWKFFTTILRNRQQWMANCLLTGKTPREALKGEDKISKLSDDSVLATATEKLRSIKTTSSEETMAILEFFTSAQNHWPWTIFAMQKDSTFLQDLRSYVRELRSPSAVSRTDAAEAGFQARIAAYIAETFAMQLYHLRQIGQEQTFATEVVNDLDYFLRDGVQVDGYNASLHANFARNFNRVYPGCSIDDFKRTVLAPKELGANFFYALDAAESMLSYDPGWHGPRKNGFRHEMETANLNLSLVEAEVALFHAWEYLVLELSVCLLPKNATIARQMLQVAEQCLESNLRPQPPDNIFVRLTHSRANLTLTLLQRLARSSHLPSDITKLLTRISATINAVDDPFHVDRISYFRTLLKILFVVLRGSRHSANSAATQNSGSTDSPVAVTQLVLTILERVVAKLFRTLVTLVHETDSATTPEDIALITALLQACLAVPGIDQCQVQILNIMSSYDVLQVAISLFSWADKLADNGDPIYGELALLFLLELSALPSIAEQLACDGVLDHLTSASLTGFIRRGNVSPFSDNAGAARCYGIWAKGILPLLLNIFGALGSTIAPEVAVVLNQFPNLLQSSVERFEAPGISRTASRDSLQYISLISISEIHSLALLTRVLGALRGGNACVIPPVDWDAGSVLENVDFWLRSRKILRERLLPLGPRETDWRATKALDGSGCENMLEEKAVEQLEAVRDVLATDDFE
ncbi:nucleoporin subcomplex protein binding to Pom34-domain-containing protein [Podospora didyma]|uniref:Nucleoporin NUP188 n=1 Tax=Podospora didyma TaxID=330526 RepID=A0AAE0KEC2_9PEZI|nr:nucleoporin subcomplex protein binding to Pom34-domain-containing protein [Podospora didyma]